MKNNTYFVSSIKGETKQGNRPYNLVTLSNGLRAYTVSNPKNLDTTGLLEGDLVEVLYKHDVNYKNELVLTLAEIKKAKI